MKVINKNHNTRCYRWGVVGWNRVDHDAEVADERLLVVLLGLWGPGCQSL
jgi:hypothetical protein